METRLIELGGLPKNPAIWDVGAYKGQWSKEIRDIYPDADIRIFEPVQEYAAAIEAAGLPPVDRFGMSDHDHALDITIAGDRSSTYEMGYSGNTEQIALRDVADVLGYQKVDVMKINVEGAEYPILDRLIATNKMSQVGIFLIQFHTFIPSFGERYLDIKKGMLRTHTLAWRTPFVWERWDIVPPVTTK